MEILHTKLITSLNISKEHHLDSPPIDLKTLKSICQKSAKEALEILSWKTWNKDNGNMKVNIWDVCLRWVDRKKLYERNSEWWKNVWLLILHEWKSTYEVYSYDNDEHDFMNEWEKLYSVKELEMSIGERVSDKESMKFPTH